MDFTITLSDDDWDSVKGGWRCPALQIPGARVKYIYVNGALADPTYYEVHQEVGFIQWLRSYFPGQAAVHVGLDKELSTEELTVKWKKLAVILPVIGTLGAAILTAALRVSGSDSTGGSTVPGGSVPKLFTRSNDFLATGDGYQFPSILKRTKREAWFIGTTFYISTDQYHDLIMEKLAAGVDLNFLVLNPQGDAVGKVARLLGVAEKELALDCASGIHILSRIVAEAAMAKSTGMLRAKLIDEPIQTRMYMFDPKTDDGYVYYIPQINGTNSQRLPGFLIRNSHAPYHSIYFDSVLKMWSDPSTMSLEAWMASHADANQ
jgi:hypothetical protein